MSGQPVALHGDVDAHRLAQRGEDVDVLGEALDDRPAGGIGRRGRVAHDADDVMALLEPSDLLLEAVVAELLAMVRRHDDVGVVPRSDRLEAVPHPTELRVDVADHPEVLPPQVTQLGRIGRRRRHRVAERGAVERVGIVDRRDRLADVGVVVVGGPVPGGRVRRVRAQVARVREPRPVLALDPLDQPIGEERGDAVLHRPVGLGLERDLGVHALVPELLEPPPPRPVVGGHVELGVEAGQDPLVGVEPRIVGPVRLGRIDALVRVAPHRRRVPGPAGGAGDVVEAVVERRAVAHHAVVQLVGAGVEAGPPGRARVALGVVAGEPHAARRPAGRGSACGPPGGQPPTASRPGTGPG